MTKFTKEEKIVLAFILSMAFIGMGILYWKKANPAPSPIIEFDESRIPQSRKVNINEASATGLIKIKNIGPVLAGRIISYREEYGSFRRLEDIKSVKGIGEKTFEKIKDQIRID